jgi:hypothetical protein
MELVDFIYFTIYLNAIINRLKNLPPDLKTLTYRRAQTTKFVWLLGLKNDFWLNLEKNQSSNNCKKTKNICIALPVLAKCFCKGILLGCDREDIFLSSLYPIANRGYIKIV